MAALDFPNSPTNGQQYSAPNGVIYTYDGVAWTTSGVLSTGSAAGGDLQGSYPSPTIKPSALPWSVSGATLTPTDAAKAKSVPGILADGTCIAATGTVKVQTGVNATRMMSGGALTANYNYSGGWVRDDTSRPGWLLGINAA